MFHDQLSYFFLTGTIKFFFMNVSSLINADGTREYQSPAAHYKAFQYFGQYSRTTSTLSQADKNKFMYGASLSPNSIGLGDNIKNFAIICIKII